MSAEYQHIHCIHISIVSNIVPYCVLIGHPKRLCKRKFQLITLLCSMAHIDKNASLSYATLRIKTAQEYYYYYHTMVKCLHTRQEITECNRSLCTPSPFPYLSCFSNDDAHDDTFTIVLVKYSLKLSTMTTCSFRCYAQSPACMANIG